MTVTDLTAHDSPGAKAARTRLANIIQGTTKDRAHVIQQVMSVSIVDRLAHPKTLEFHFNPSFANRIFFTLQGREDVPATRIHRHALGQIADKSGMGRTFSSRLYDNDESWAQHLLAYNLNTLFRETSFSDARGETRSFLLRVVGDELRGFQGHNYNRLFTTSRLLPTFLEGCAAHDAGPIGVTVSDIRVSIKFAMPYVFEPVPGEYVAFGVDFSNSDFGAGRTKLSGTVMRIRAGATSVLDDAYSRTHLGPVVKESDIQLSEEAENDQLQAARSAMKDVIKALFSYETIDANLKLIQAAHERQIPWHQLREKLRKVLSQKDIDFLKTLLESKVVVDLPSVARTDDGSAVATAWWASSALSMMADGEEEPNRQIELREAAGSLL